MSFDFLKNHLVKIKIDGRYGTGAIFKPEDESIILYILTSKHNFFEDKSYSTNDLSLSTKKFTIEITHELSGKNINIKNQEIHFFESDILDDSSKKHIDLALLIVDINEDSKDLLIDTISVPDDNNKIDTYDTRYSLFGYPHYKNFKGEKEVVHYKLEFSQNSSDFYFESIFKNQNGFIGFDESDNHQEELNGISGSPIFLLSKNHKPYLHSITFGTSNFNEIKAIRINTLLDKINDRILKINEKYPEIQSSSSIILSNEKLSFNELNEFEDFKEKIRLNSDLLDFLSKESESDINIKSTSLQLSECNRKLNEQCDELSYRYAHLAILAQEKGLKAATTSYLSKAIDWNPQHIHALLHERAERKNDIEALKAMTPVILSEKIKKYKKIIASEKNSSERIKLLKEAITEINSTETKPNTTEHNNKELQVNNYCKDLENLYYNDQEQQYIHKYKKLADFYYETRNLQEKSTKFYLISLELLDKSVNNENHKSIREEIIPKINLLSEKHIIDNIKIEAKEIANFIIHENEDKETKEIINQLYKEVLDLKNKENYRDEFYGSLLDTLFSLNISIDKQIIQNINSNSKIKLGNNNNEKINDIIEEFKSHISILPKKDLEFRNSIESTIESSLTDLISQFEKFRRL